MKIRFFKFVIIFVLLSLTGFASEKNLQTVVAIDLDGVLNNYTKYEKDKIPEIKDGAKEFVEKLYNSNYKLILFTNRSPKQATQWLIKNNLDSYFADVTNVKPIATIYLDDRAINFNGNYKKALEEISNFKVYWKNSLVNPLQTPL